MPQPSRSGEYQRYSTRQNVTNCSEFRCSLDAVKPESAAFDLDARQARARLCASAKAQRSAAIVILTLGRRIVGIRELQLHRARHFLKRRPTVGGASFVPLAGQRRQQFHGAYHAVARDQRQLMANAEAVEQCDIEVGVPAHPAFTPQDLPQPTVNDRKRWLPHQIVRVDAVDVIRALSISILLKQFLREARGD